MSNPVTIHSLGNGIFTMALEDRMEKNTFSRALIEGLMHGFKQIDADTTAKVVVLHGYDRYFCCGGTKDELIDIYEGRLTFSDVAFYRLLLDCRIPVIAAMQGHAIGGGLAFGCFADLILMAEEAVYSANFMKYGFTPGMGATLIIPRKLGEILGAEMLLSARNYHGRELKERGVSARVLPKPEVIPAAIALARDLAAMPRTSLVLLKETLSRPIREALPGAVERELAMHEVTFRQPEVRQRIDTLFGA